MPLWRCQGAARAQLDTHTGTRGIGTITREHRSQPRSSLMNGCTLRRSAADSGQQSRWHSAPAPSDGDLARHSASCALAADSCCVILFPLFLSAGAGHGLLDRGRGARHGEALQPVAARLQHFDQCPSASASFHHHQPFPGSLLQRQPALASPCQPHPRQQAFASSSRFRAASSSVSQFQPVSGNQLFAAADSVRQLLQIQPVAAGVGQLPASSVD